MLEPHRHETYNLLSNYTYFNNLPPILVGCQTSLKYLSAITTPYSLLQIVVGLGDAAVKYYVG